MADKMERPKDSGIDKDELEAQKFLDTVIDIIKEDV